MLASWGAAGEKLGLTNPVPAAPEASSRGIIFVSGPEGHFGGGRRRAEEAIFFSPGREALSTIPAGEGGPGKCAATSAFPVLADTAN